jgi:hypothetical protein
MILAPAADAIDVWPNRRIVELLTRTKEPSLVCVHEGGEVSYLHWDPLFRMRSWAARASHVGLRGYPKSRIVSRGLLTHDEWDVLLWSDGGTLLAECRPGDQVHAVTTMPGTEAVVVSQANGVTTVHDADLREIARHVGPNEGGWTVTTCAGLVVVGRDNHVELLEQETLEEVALLTLPRRLASTNTFDGSVIVEDMGASLYLADASGLRYWRAGSWVGAGDGVAWILDADRGLLAFSSLDASGEVGSFAEITPKERPRAVIPTGGGSTIVVGHQTVWTIDRVSWSGRVLWESEQEILAEAIIRNSLIVSQDGALLRVCVP